MLQFVSQKGKKKTNNQCRLSAIKKNSLLLGHLFLLKKYKGLDIPVCPMP